VVAGGPVAQRMGRDVSIRIFSEIFVDTWNLKNFDKDLPRWNFFHQKSYIDYVGFCTGSHRGN
jgi:hypothetical protein